MLPFLHFHAIAAGRGDGLRPEFCALVEGSETSPCDVVVRANGMLQAGPDPVSTQVRYATDSAAASLQSDEATESTTDALLIHAPEGYGPADGMAGQLRFPTYSEHRRLNQ
jgi:hypothetical protein